MTKYNSIQILDELIADVEAIIETVQNEFITLDNDLLYKQPAPDKWSVNQCLQHLNVTGCHYLPRIKTAIEGAVGSCQKGTETYRSSWISEMAVNYTKPLADGAIPKPMKAFKKEFNPILSEYKQTSAIPEFLKQKKQLLHYLRQARQVNLGKNKVTSLLPILRFRLGDAFRLLIAHEQRHVLQAKHVLEVLYKR
jgi:hypothetical protein